MNSVLQKYQQYCHEIIEHESTVQKHGRQVNYGGGTFIKMNICTLILYPEYIILIISFWCKFFKALGSIICLNMFDKYESMTWHKIFYFLICSLTNEVFMKIRKYWNGHC